jgi:hypothetical protein
MERRARLRAMSTGEIMDTATRAYQHLGTLILKTTAGSALVALAAVVFVTSYALPLIGVTSDAENVAVQVAEASSALALAIFVGGPLFFMSVGYASALITLYVSDYMRGVTPSADSARREAMRLMPKMILLGLREIFTAGGGLLLAIGALMASALLDTVAPEEAWMPVIVSAIGILGLMVGIVVLPFVLARHALSIPAAVIEGLGPAAAIQRSGQLLRPVGSHPSGYNAVVALLTVMFFLFIFILIGVSAALALIGLSDWANTDLASFWMREIIEVALEYLPWFLVIWTVLPVWCATVTILYYERRTRLEGYDIEALARDVAQSDRQSRFEL